MKNATQKRVALVLPFRVFGATACPRALPPACALSELASRSECSGPPGYRVIGSAIPPCRWASPSASRSSPGERDGSWFIKPRPSSRRVRLSFRVCISRTWPSDGSCDRHPFADKPEGPPERLLSWAFVPHSTCGIEGPHHAGFACPLRSARRVWLPSRRFAPLGASPALFRAGSAFGIHPSELSPPARSPGRFRPEEPTCRFP